MLEKLLFDIDAIEKTTFKLSEEAIQKINTNATDYNAAFLAFQTWSKIEILSLYEMHAHQWMAINALLDAHIRVGEDKYTDENGEHIYNDFSENRYQWYAQIIDEAIAARSRLEAQLKELDATYDYDGFEPVILDSDLYDAAKRAANKGSEDKEEESEDG